MADPWLNDPIWQTYQRAIGKVSAADHEKRAKIAAEAMAYVEKKYWRQPELDLGLIPVETQGTVQQGSLF